MACSGPDAARSPFFDLVAGRLLPTDDRGLAGHGGTVAQAALAAVAARAADQIAGGCGLLPARIGCDFLRPARFAPIDLRTAPREAGAGRELHQIDLEQDGAPVLRCTVLLLPGAATPATDPAHPEGTRPSASGRFGPPADAAPISAAERALSPCFDGMATRIVTGGLLRPGPAVAWLRLERPLVGVEPASPLARAVHAAKLAARIAGLGGPGLAGVAVDLDMHLWRQPAGQWVLVEARVETGAAGAGTALATLHDLAGPFAVTAATLMLVGGG